jgi:hypothetical protein
LATLRRLSLLSPWHTTMMSLLPSHFTSSKPAPHVVRTEMRVNENAVSLRCTVDEKRPMAVWKSLVKLDKEPHCCNLLLAAAAAVCS